MELPSRHFTATVLHKSKSIFWNLSLKADYLKNWHPLSLELNYLFPQNISFCLRRVMWCVSQPILFSIPICLNSSIFQYLGPECPFGRLSKHSCLLLAFYCLPILFLLLCLVLFRCQVTEGVPWAHSSQISLGLSGTECPSTQSQDSLSALQLSLKFTSLRKCLAPCQSEVL